MKLIKKLAISILSICLVLTCLTTNNVKATTKSKHSIKSNQSRKKIYIKLGKTTTLKIKRIPKKAKIKWTVSKKGIIKIVKKRKNNCKIFAKKIGTTTIKAKYKNKIYKFKIKVIKRINNNNNNKNTYNNNNIKNTNTNSTNVDTTNKSNNNQSNTENNQNNNEDNQNNNEQINQNDTDLPNEISFNDKKYSLTFSDDFDYLDFTKWGYCPEMERQDIGGMWRNSCSSIQDGNYVITCDVTDEGIPISGGIRSKQAYSQAYGLYHIRFKMEKADALWYAFWLYTDKMEEGSVGNGAVDGAELDIIELVPHTKELCMSVHWDGYDEYLQSHCETTYITDSFFDQYHELWYEWDEDGYRLYMDGTDENALILTISSDEWGDGSCATPCDIVISAEFGKWGGEVNKSQLPAHFYVDYVRAYQKIGSL